MSYSGTIITGAFKTDYHFNSETYKLTLEVTNKDRGARTCLFHNKDGYELWLNKIHKHYPNIHSEQELMHYTLIKIFDHINTKYHEYTTDYITYFLQARKHYNEDELDISTLEAYLTIKAAIIAWCCNIPYQQIFNIEEINLSDNVISCKQIHNASSSAYLMI
jgi:hypothetical protein